MPKRSIPKKGLKKELSPRKEKIGKRSASKRKESKAKDYEYTPLKDLAKTEKDRVNVYAIVLDCSAPYFMKPTGKYQCTMKLIDDSMYPVEGKKAPECISVTIFAKTAAEIPKPARIGTVIRLHRAQSKKHKSSIQLNCDVNIKGSWCIFDPIDGVSPIDHSARGFSFDENDKRMLKSLRNFSKDYFGKHELSAVTLKQAASKKPSDFDVLCLVLNIKKKSKNENVTLCDADKVVKLSIPISRKLNLANHEVVRIRSANYADKKEYKTLSLNEYSNVLIVPKEFYSAKALVEKIEKHADKEVKAKMASVGPVIDAPIVASKILNTHKQSKVTHLKDLFGLKDVKKDSKYHRIHVNVTEIGPKDPKDWICIVDKKTKKQYKLDEIFGKGKKVKQLPSNMEYYYKMQFFVKDKSVSSDPSLYIFFLCTIEGKCADFFKLKLGNEEPTEKHFKELKKIYKTLTKPGVILDAMVEFVEVSGKHPVFFMVDTVLTI